MEGTSKATIEGCLIKRLGLLMQRIALKMRGDSDGFYCELPVGPTAKVMVLQRSERKPLSRFDGIRWQCHFVAIELWLKIWLHLTVMRVSK